MRRGGLADDLGWTGRGGFDSHGRGGSVAETTTMAVAGAEGGDQAVGSLEVEMPRRRRPLEAGCRVR